MLYSKIFIVTLVMVGWSLFVANPVDGQQEVTVNSSDHERIVLIPLEDGTVSCDQLFDAVSSELHWVAGSITAFSRGMGIPSGSGTRLQPEQVQSLVDRFPDLFEFQSTADDSHEFLTVNVAQLAEVLADRKSRLRRFLAEVQNAELASISKVAETWPDAIANPRRVIVTISGLNATASSAQAAAVELHRRTNLPSCVFAYPNDGPILESAGMLVLALQDLHDEYPGTRFTLVTHSMGGLVARAALELSLQESAPRIYDVASATGVTQLIQICPPNHGSALAEYGPLLEPAEQLYRLVRRRSTQESRVLLRSIVDGFNEASADLSPASSFIEKLNACSRNPQIEYTIFAGSGGPLPIGVAGLLGDVWEQISSSTDEPEALNRRIREVLSCSELQRGRGDGVVSIDSARLDGVSDFQVLPMHHLVWEQLNSSDAQDLLDRVSLKLGIRL